ncbi:fungal specific transcription factor domain-containing protein [Aspergillus thermomutatus]|uniref:Xylanolytic transcriptional activator regulatory domain-containing protein n=1 Tax=Aspergillus thermomutatus TaxID=41047 RepID=A0A397H3T1_ASPTH|nr:uncharacterized protein CDV56_101804 [Aspergillus thermomutatus]RHZ57667.1 hypothetical protein CDV56_101804 [Aspergillus thermomutatus]
MDMSFAAVGLALPMTSTPENEVIKNLQKRTVIYHPNRSTRANITFVDIVEHIVQGTTCMEAPSMEMIAPAILKTRALDLTAFLIAFRMILKNTPILLSLPAASLRLQRSYYSPQSAGRMIPGGQPEAQRKTTPETQEDFAILDTPVGTHDDSILPFRQTLDDLQARVQRLEQHLLGENGPRPQPTRNAPFPQSLQELDARIFGIEQRLVTQPADQPTSQPCSIPPVLPHLRASADKTKLFGPSSWSHTFEQLHAIRKVRMATKSAPSNDVQTAEMTNLFKTCRNLRRTIKARDSPQLIDPVPDLLRNLPTREVCDQLVHHYLRTLELVYRVLHVPSFQRDYHCFWDDPESARRGFVLKLLLVISIGSIFHADETKCAPVRSSVRRWVCAARWWLTGLSEASAANLEGVQVFCLLLLCRQTHTLGKESVWVSAGSLVRLAFSLGLHRDPKHFPSLSVFECQMRRRLWATVLELATQTSLDAFMPPLISVDDYDTEHPLNLDDADIDETTATPPAPKPTGHYTDSSVQIVLLHSLRTRLQIARMINRVHSELPYHEALELGAALSTSCNDIAIFIHTHSAQHSNHPMKPTDFHHKHLTTYLHRSILLLHRPFTLHSLTDPRFHLSRKLSLESATTILSLLNTPDNPPDDFTRLSSSGAGTFRGPLSLDIISALCLEIITQLEVESARCPHPSTAIPGSELLDEIARSARHPLLHTLQRAQAHLLQAIADGKPSMKRYGILSVALRQIEAMSAGTCPMRVIRDALVDVMRTCAGLLQGYLDTTEAGDRPTEGVDDWDAMGFTPDSDLDFLLRGMGWDSALLEVPNPTDEYAVM